MNRDKDIEYHPERHRSLHHHGHHRRGYTSIIKRTENEVLIPQVLLEVADVEVGDFLEITIRKVRKPKKSS